MKKAIAFLLAFALIGGVVFAQEATIEDRVAALESQPALKVSGSVTFEFGDADTREGEGSALPVFSAAKTGTATLSLGTTDDKVTAAVGVNLLALPGVTSALSLNDPDAAPDWYAPSTATKYTDYGIYNDIAALVTFYNDNVATYEDYWVEANQDAIVAALGDLDDESAIDELAIIDFESADYDTLAEQTALNISAIYTAVNGAMFTAVNNAVAAILDEATSTVLNGFNTASALYTFFMDTVPDGYYAEYWEDLSDDDKDLAMLAADLGHAKEVADLAITAPYGATGSVANTVAGNYLTSASLKFSKVFGLVDITAVMAGAHAAAGSIKADLSGHQEDAVKAYQGITFGLASGIVEGLSVAGSFYADSNVVAEAVSDSWYTMYSDETVAATNAKYAGALKAGYTMAIGEDISVGTGLGFAAYDVLTADAMNWALSVTPAVSAFGATLDGEFAILGNQVMYINGNLGYSIMGIAISASGYLVKGPYAWTDDATTVMDTILGGNDTGYLGFGGSLAIDIVELAGLAEVIPAASVNGGATYAVADEKLAWNAGLSVSPFEAVTLSGGLSADQVTGSTADWNVALEYAYTPAATIYGNVASAYNTDDEVNVVSYAIGTKVTF